MRPLNRDVFINCPFDADYEPLFHAICFTVISCGFNRRSALEVKGNGESRLEKIYRLIRDCDLGIHDISRTELDASGLPRFNMPFELGLFLGCKRWGGKHHARKHMIILDREKHRHVSFFSDLAAYDPELHGGEAIGAIEPIRNWLQMVAGNPMLGPGHIADSYRLLRQDLPGLCEPYGWNENTAPFQDLMHIMHNWLRDQDDAAALNPFQPSALQLAIVSCAFSPSR